MSMRRSFSSPLRLVNALVAGVMAVAFSSPAAAADEARPQATSEAPRIIPDRPVPEGTPLVANKLFPMANRVELSGFYNLSLADKYFSHQGGHISAGYHFFDWLSAEVVGGFLLPRESSLLQAVRQESDAPVPPMPDLFQTNWYAGADVQWAPLYGKLSLASEYDLSFQFYGMAGAGVEGTERRNGAQEAVDTNLRVVGSYGIGLRLIPHQNVAIRLELKQSIGANPDVPEDDNEACSDGYKLTLGDAPECFKDYSDLSLFQAGVSFIF